MGDVIRLLERGAFLKAVGEPEGVEPVVGNESLGLMKAVPGVKAIDKEARTVDFVISSESKDRDGDIIRAGGWDLKPFKQNPVVLFAHDHRSLPIAQAPTIRIDRAGKVLTSTAQFPEEGFHALSDTVFGMLERKLLRMSSVGFLPREWKRLEEDEDDPPGRFTGFDFTKQELLEWSVVPVGSNRDALAQARSLGIRTDPLREWAARLLDEFDEYEKEGHLWARKDTLERLLKNADPGQKTTHQVPPEKQEDLARRRVASAQAAAARQQLEEAGVWDLARSLLGLDEDAEITLDEVKERAARAASLMQVAASAGELVACGTCGAANAPGVETCGGCGGEFKAAPEPEDGEVEVAKVQDLALEKLQDLASVIRSVIESDRAERIAAEEDEKALEIEDVEIVEAEAPEPDDDLIELEEGDLERLIGAVHEGVVATAREVVAEQVRQLTGRLPD